MLRALNPKIIEDSALRLSQFAPSASKLVGALLKRPVFILAEVGVDMKDLIGVVIDMLEAHGCNFKISPGQCNAKQLLDVYPLRFITGDGFQCCYALPVAVRTLLAYTTLLMEC